MRERYAHAVRHGRRVRALRVALPAVLVAGMASYALASVIGASLRQDIVIDLGNLDVSGDRLVMEMPKLSGFNRQDEAYVVTAATATQRVTAPGRIDLADLKATITTKENETADITATAGLFDSTSERLRLTGGVSLRSTHGYAANLLSADVDFKAGSLVSDEPVSVALRDGTVDAGTMRIDQGGDVIYFEGNVAARFQTRRAAPGEETTP